MGPQKLRLEPGSSTGPQNSGQSREAPWGLRTQARVGKLHGASELRPESGRRPGGSRLRSGPRSPTGAQNSDQRPEASRGPDSDQRQDSHGAPRSELGAPGFSRSVSPGPWKSGLAMRDRPRSAAFPQSRPGQQGSATIAASGSEPSCPGRQHPDRWCDRRIGERYTNFGISGSWGCSLGSTDILRPPPLHGRSGHHIHL